MSRQTLLQTLALAGRCATISCAAVSLYGASFSAAIVNEPLVFHGDRPVSAAAAILQGARATFGILDVANEQPTVELTVADGTKLSDALAAALGWQSHYSWTETDGCINVLPNGRLPAPMTAKIHRFQWSSAELSTEVAGRVWQAPELTAALASAGIRRDTVALMLLSAPPALASASEEPRQFEKRDLSALELLNAIVTSYSHPSMWVYRERSAAGGRYASLIAY